MLMDALDWKQDDQVDVYHVDNQSGKDMLSGDTMFQIICYKI